MFWYYFFAGIVGYLIGSCPNGYLIGRASGVDVRQHGSGNIGATNVLRVVGKKWGYLVFALDAFKGLAAVRIGMAFGHVVAPFDIVYTEFGGILAGLACILGHAFPVWLHFRGGKGVATSAGVLLGLMPLAVVSVFVVWVVLFQLTGYVSLASISAAVALPIFVALYLRMGAIAGAGLLPFSVVIAAVVVWRHRSNIERLVRGKEQRFGDR